MAQKKFCLLVEAPGANPAVVMDITMGLGIEAIPVTKMKLGSLNPMRLPVDLNLGGVIVVGNPGRTIDALRTLLPDTAIIVLADIDQAHQLPNVAYMTDPFEAFETIETHICLMGLPDHGTTPEGLIGADTIENNIHRIAAVA